jgi:type II secretory pathway pseudopilin PulG
MLLNRRRGGERGFALVPAMLVMMILIGLAAATVALSQGDQVSARHEREGEASFQLAEGVMNAQIFRLSTRWPGVKDPQPYPTSCTVTSTVSDCPSNATVNQNFAGVDYGTGTTWTTQVRDNGGASPNFWSDDLLNTQPPYDANGDDFVWVRAQAVVRGRKRTLVALVQAESVTLNFPRAAFVGGHFDVSNSGNKIVIDTNGTSDQFTPGDVIVRCTLGTSGCADYDTSKGQIAPDTVRSNAGQPPAVAPEALDQLRTLAKAQGNYYTGCAPSLAGDQPGEIVFMEDATGCTYNANNVYNTAAAPGYVVIARGAMGQINGTATFYGIIYHANLDNACGDLVTLSGNVSVYGSIVIDGCGGLLAGSSSVNLVYDPNVFSGFKALGTAAIVQNTFREVTG